VGPDGDIVLPLIGAVKAVGLRPPQLAEQVRASLVKGSYYANPVIRVEVVLVASRYVTVLGQVGSPGLISLDRNYRLSEILAKVGARIGAGGGDYVVLTHEDGTQQKLRMTEIATGVANQDPVVLSGDKIFVPAAENEVIYVNGAVRAPGMFPIMAGMTVRTALARAGGVDENGSEGKFDLYRKGEKVRDATLDTPLQVGDIVKFGERMF
jgi:polysaccharide export outer membrane protein